ncbi:MAG: hypothetical protein E7378_01375 [Clostridiales bacterium]|nr:hypothetical protein [Clostridiales bacterium]
MRVRICPDCGMNLHFDASFGLYMHDDITACCHMEDSKGNCLWNNKMRSESLKKSFKIKGQENIKNDELVK